MPVTPKNGLGHRRKTAMYRERQQLFCGWTWNVPIGSSVPRWWLCFGRLWNLKEMKPRKGKSAGTLGVPSSFRARPYWSYSLRPYFYRCSSTRHVPGTKHFLSWQTVSYSLTCILQVYTNCKPKDKNKTKVFFFFFPLNCCVSGTDYSFGKETPMYIKWLPYYLPLAQGTDFSRQCFNIKSWPPRCSSLRLLDAGKITGVHHHIWLKSWLFTHSKFQSANTQAAVKTSTFCLNPASCPGLADSSTGQRSSSVLSPGHIGNFS